MVWTLLLLASTLLFAILGWLRGRPKGWIFPSDAFFLVSIVVVGIVPFLNLRATAPDVATFRFQNDAIQRALLAVSLMYGVFGCVWLVRPAIAVQRLVVPRGQRGMMWRQVSGLFAFGAIAFVVLSLLVLMYPPYLSYKMDVINFIFGQIDANRYKEARRILYVDNTFIGSFIGRMRYTIYPILFLTFIMFFLRKKSLVLSFCIGAILTIVGPASMSKAVFLLYLLYFSVAYALENEMNWILRQKNLVLVAVIAIPTVMTLLSFIYFLQYPQLFSSFRDVPDAFRLTFYRMFVATYQGLLQYFGTYPDPYPFAGVSGTSISFLFGVPTRNLDVEVSTYFLGQRGYLTSFPTIFIGNAYASFGYLGVLIYSILVAIFLYFVDKGAIAVRNHYLRVIYLSTMMVNVLHFAVLAAPTALVTYGCAVIPIIVLLTDRAVKAPSRVSINRHSAGKRGFPRFRNGRSRFGAIASPRAD